MHTDNPQNRDYNIDTLKAISILLVFIWHVPVLSFLNSGNNSLHFAVSKIYNLFTIEVNLLAVPTFYLVALYLFVKKRASNAYFIKRCLRLLKIYCFWMSVQFIVYIICNNEIPEFKFDYLKIGGPSLPHVAGSVFYFLYVLIILTILSYLFVQLNSDVQNLISKIIFVISIFLFELSLWWNKYSIAFENIINFLYLVPLSFYMVKNYEFFIQKRFHFLFLYIFFIIQDVLVRLLVTERLPVYGRLSVWFGVLTLFCFIMNRQKKISSIVKILSTYSLGIFAVHKYAYLIANYTIGDSGCFNLFGVGIDIRTTSLFFLTALLTFLCLLGLRKTWIKNFIY